MPGRYKMSFFACLKGMARNALSLSVSPSTGFDYRNYHEFLTSGNKHAARGLPILIDWHSDSSLPTGAGAQHKGRARVRGKLLNQIYYPETVPRCLWCTPLQCIKGFESYVLVLHEVVW